VLDEDGAEVDDAAPVVPEGFRSSSIYPYVPSPPQISLGNPGQGLVHLEVDTWIDLSGTKFEHQHESPLTIARAYVSLQKSWHRPSDWYMLWFAAIEAVLMVAQ
jgi:hypothetical protein